MGGLGLVQGSVTYRLRSSSSLMMHVAPVLLHWAHSDSPSPTTHRILLSRHEAQAIEARWRIWCLVDDRDEGAGLDACSESALSLSPSERDLRFPPEVTAAAMVENSGQCVGAKFGVPGVVAQGIRRAVVKRPGRVRADDRGKQKSRERCGRGKRQMEGTHVADTRERTRVC
jgi:hypothetical protein